MSAKKENQEPTMEEILASIRRIISEEGEEPKAAPAAADVALDDEPEEDVLELTEVLDELEPVSEPEPASVVVEPSVDEPLELTDDVDEVAHAFAKSEEDELDAPSEPEPEPEPVPELEETFAMNEDESAGFADVVDPAEEGDAIMSSERGQKVSESFDRLSELLVAGYEGHDKTLEGMVREMLKPMLKAWLDENLPGIVDRVVAREVARLSRVKKP